MDLFEAIKQMRKLSSQGKSFSFSFMSYSLSRGTSHGIVEVQSARLIKQSKKEQNSEADIMLNYIDLATNECKHFYQLLLIEFNNNIVELN